MHTPVVEISFYQSVNKCGELVWCVCAWVGGVMGLYIDRYITKSQICIYNCLNGMHAQMHDMQTKEISKIFQRWFWSDYECTCAIQLRAVYGAVDCSIRVF